jgi:hypothetical protein
VVPFPRIVGTVSAEGRWLVTESSFIGAFSSRALEQLANAIGGQAPVTVLDFRPLADAIGRLQVTAVRLLERVDNPRRTGPKNYPATG